MVRGKHFRSLPHDHLCRMFFLAQIVYLPYSNLLWIWRKQFWVTFNFLLRMACKSSTLFYNCSHCKTEKKKNKNVKFGFKIIDVVYVIKYVEFLLGHKVQSRVMQRNSKLEVHNLLKKFAAIFTRLKKNINKKDLLSRRNYEYWGNGLRNNCK